MTNWSGNSVDYTSDNYYDFYNSMPLRASSAKPFEVYAIVHRDGYIKTYQFEPDEPLTLGDHRGRRPTDREINIVGPAFTEKEKLILDCIRAGIGTDEQLQAVATKTRATRFDKGVPRDERAAHKLKRELHPEHGTANWYYNHHCRCEACTHAASEYQRHRQQARRQAHQARLQELAKHG